MDGEPRSEIAENRNPGLIHATNDNTSNTEVGMKDMKVERNTTPPFRSDEWPARGAEGVNQKRQQQRNAHRKRGGKSKRQDNTMFDYGFKSLHHG